jgi:class 3 adenylate cyclase
MRYFIQNAPDEALPLLARYERSSCTPHMVEEIMRRNIEIDIRSILPTINVPTLVIHATGDPAVPIQHGRYLAEHIPGARLLELNNNFHGEWSGANFVPEIREFLLGDAVTPKADRLLATVLFTDIVSSTQRDVELGDRRWRRLLDDHDRTVRSQVERFLGRIVKTTGDGVLATFDGPARGIECAMQLAKAVKPLGLEVRAGLHTGEIELRGNDIAGLGVVIARRVCDLASSGEVLASRTVRDLVIGSDITFEDRGTYALKGVPDEWQLYAVAS